MRNVRYLTKEKNAQKRREADFQSKSFLHADGSNYMYLSKTRTDHNGLISVTTPNATSLIGHELASRNQ